MMDLKYYDGEEMRDRVSDPDAVSDSTELNYANLLITSWGWT
jgi:hypothetical protein